MNLNRRRWSVAPPAKDFLRFQWKTGVIWVKLDEIGAAQGVQGQFQQRLMKLLMGLKSKSERSLKEVLRAWQSAEEGAFAHVTRGQIQLTRSRSTRKSLSCLILLSEGIIQVKIQKEPAFFDFKSAKVERRSTGEGFILYCTSPSSIYNTCKNELKSQVIHLKGTILAAL